jgi:hypothetical protein
MIVYKETKKAMKTANARPMKITMRKIAARSIKELGRVLVRWLLLRRKTQKKAHRMSQIRKYFSLWDLWHNLNNHSLIRQTHMR